MKAVKARRRRGGGLVGRGWGLTLRRRRRAQGGGAIHRPPRKRQVQGGANLWRGGAWASHLRGGGPREGRFLGVSPQRRRAQREVGGIWGGATS